MLHFAENRWMEFLRSTVGLKFCQKRLLRAKRLLVLTPRRGAGLSFARRSGFLKWIRCQTEGGMARTTSSAWTGSSVLPLRVFVLREFGSVSRSFSSSCSVVCASSTDTAPFSSEMAVTLIPV